MRSRVLSRPTKVGVRSEEDKEEVVVEERVVDLFIHRGH